MVHGSLFAQGAILLCAAVVASVGCDSDGTGGSPATDAGNGGAPQVNSASQGDGSVPSSQGGDATRSDPSGCASPPAWESGVTYAAGDKRRYGNAVYRCLQSHTSQTLWTPDSTPALWQLTGDPTCSGTAPDSDAGTAILDATPTKGADDGSSEESGGFTGSAPAGLIFSPYKDTSINMDWNTNIISTKVPGTATSLGSDLVASGGKTITLAFATGECGQENWGGVSGSAMASANVSKLTVGGVHYVISTGGAAGSFTCASDAGFSTFVNRWASSALIGVDFDIEAGQSKADINNLLQRIQTAHGTYPGLRFSLTLATLANNNGAPTAQSLGVNAPDSFNTYGDQVMAAVKTVFGFSGAGSMWPGYLTVDLMTMDYGSPGAGVCVVNNAECAMGQSAIQAAFNLHDKWSVPYANIELTPMIGGNDVSSEHFTLADADAVASFAISHGLAGVHYWSFDRDTDCAAGSASPTCNSMGSGYAGVHGYLKRFLADGLH